MKYIPPSWRYLKLLLGVVALACADGPTQLQETTPVAELRERWEASGIRSYQYDLTVVASACFRTAVA
ncbi:MAG: hypothetical protein KIT38_08045 [Gemmatimonadaceae bacterium]|nr:hypothetical protein [Gemmatimonadaceae bacterium]